MYLYLLFISEIDFSAQPPFTALISYRGLYYRIIQQRYSICQNTLFLEIRKDKSSKLDN